jgi:luciferase family oxidoreductase group 1
VQELQAYLAPAQPGPRIEAVPGSGTRVPLWILGSSLFSGRLAAELGLPYGFASHFAPQSLDAALEIYREQFKPSAPLDKSYALVGVNIIAAANDDEARFLATSQQMSFADIFRGVRSLTQPPIADIETYWTRRRRLKDAGPEHRRRPGDGAKGHWATARAHRRG